jgi:hypothetical protein
LHRMTRIGENIQHSTSTFAKAPADRSNVQRRIFNKAITQ